MPFGLTNAPFTFQLAISKIMQNIPNTNVYIDDILIASKIYGSHTRDVENVLKRLSDNQVSINYEKSEIGKPEISFLGHIINQDGTRADITKIETLKYKHPIKKASRKYIRFYKLVPTLPARIIQGNKTLL
ncbi:Retrovirus-related Pol polyprotein from transposon 17.6 [Dictyocoela roeselum]|nr:Retrovirus-related Pol polyprotein from transposon 17.6 [Dictyocoela roeselum]